jgi:hypothetical protein
MVDFSFLRQRGIDLVQQLCGDTWTDYNLHDPGVTILETLCYALTDLSYRTEFPIADILADKDGNIRLEENAFFIREDILTSNPVTVKDFRKFILDKMDKLQNVWLEPYISGFSYGTMHGLYTIKVQVKKEFSNELGKAATADNDWVNALTKEVRSCFISGRNLCEDLIHDIIVLRPVPIRIHAEVIITGNDPEHLLANIYRELEAAINPPVKYYTERELLDKGYRVEDIYTGPLLEKGFIPDVELQPRNLSIDPTELMKAISLVEGVVYVRSLSIVAPGGTTDRVPYMLDEESYPYFEHGLQESPIRLLKDKYEVRIHESVYNDIWPRVREAARRSVETVVNPRSSIRVWHGTYRDIQYYHSLQHLFPVVYGIGVDGPGRDQSAAKKTGALQLKAYLLFFEQLLANYLAQLANISKLFAIDASSTRIYYTQPLYEVPGIRRLLRAYTEKTSGPDDGAAWEAFTKDESNGYMQALQEGSGSDVAGRERKNAILDHLLARFNERPSVYPVELYTSVYEGNNKQRDRVIEWKSGLLKNIVTTSYSRVRGFDYLSKEEDNRSGFYKKMAALLYIRPAEKGVRLTDAVAGVWLPASGGGGGLPAGAATPAGSARQPRVNTGGRSWNFSGRKVSFFQHGINAGNYTIQPDASGGRGWQILFREPPGEGRRQKPSDGEGEPPAAGQEVISRHPDERSANAALKVLIGRLRQISILSEGFYVMEHVLLRPPADAASFGFRFFETKKDILLQHTRWTSFKEREDILAAILGAVEVEPPPGPGGMTEWAVKNLGGLCRVQLSRHKEIGYMSDPIDVEQWSWQEAAPDFEHLRRQLLLFKENRLAFYPRFEMLIKGHDGGPVGEEFFNFNMTILLPAWPARFQDPNFRKFAMDLFRLHAPAHIRIYFQWLNMSRMKEFEQLYPNWTAAMKNQDEPGPRKAWSEKIIHFLKKGSY